MKVILTEDVYKHGVAGEVVNVAPGFARNYLIPRGMAAKATPGAEKRYKKLRNEAEMRRQRRDDELQVLAEKVEALTLSFPVKAGERGKLYGSVTTAQIAEAIESELTFSIDRRRVGDQPLRELGAHQVAVRLSSALTPAVTVLVHREDEPPESVLEVVPSGEIEEGETIFDVVMDDEEQDEDGFEEEMDTGEEGMDADEEDSAASEGVPGEADAPEDAM